MVIEAVVENLDVKESVFALALEHFGEDAILATNTSSLSITEIAARTAAPSRVVGMHFFNPVPAMRLVEVVRGLDTDPVAAAAVAELATSWGKVVAHVQSAPGFIVNRVARPFYGEALRLAEEGAAPPETIDEILRAAGGFRMGPFELMDLIGNDVNSTVTETVWRAFHYDPRYAPSLMQRELVAAGRLGRKAGRGFYRYGPHDERPIAGRRRAVGPGARRDHAARRVAAARGPAGPRGRRAAPRRAPVRAVPADRRPGPARGDPRSHRPPRGRARGGARRRPRPVPRPREPSGRWPSPPRTMSCSARSWPCWTPRGVRAFPIDDTPGLVVARVVAMIANEAWEAAHLGVASPADIDSAMQLGHELPARPVRLVPAVVGGRRARRARRAARGVRRRPVSREQAAAGEHAHARGAASPGRGRVSR